MMRSIVLSFLFFTAVSILAERAWAQLDRSKPPIFGGKRIDIGSMIKYESFELPNGLHVLFVEDHRAPIASFSLRLLHDPFLEGDKAGCASLTGRLMQRGTKKRSEKKLYQEAEDIGVHISVSPQDMQVGGLVDHLDKMLDLMTDVLYHPAFLDYEFENVKRWAQGDLSHGAGNPEVIAGNLIDGLVYGKGHPYGEPIAEKTLKNVTLSDCIAYYNTYFRPNNAYLVVVGDMVLEKLKPLAVEWFGPWERGEDISPHAYPSLKPPSGDRVALTDFPYAVQSVVHIAYPIDFVVGSADTPQIRVLTNALGAGMYSRLYRSLREEKGYTYGAYFNAVDSNLGGMAQIKFNTRNETTGAAIAEALHQMRRIRTERLSEQELQDAKEDVVGDFIRSLESPFFVANLAFETAKFNLPADYYASYLERVRQVSADDVLATALRYILPDNAYIQVVGRYQDIVGQLKSFGPTDCYDAIANPVPCPEVEEIEPDTTATTAVVVAKYIDALGGRNMLEAIRSISARYNVDLSGLPFTLSVVKKEPLREVVEMRQPDGKAVQRIVVNGYHGMATYRAGEEASMTAHDKESAYHNARIFPELFDDLPAKLLGIGKVGSARAYVIEYIYPSGQKHTSYYDVATGLKIREVSYQDSHTGSLKVVIDMADYREYRNPALSGGITFPTRISQHFGGDQPTVFTLVDMQLNPEILDEQFIAQ